MVAIVVRSNIRPASLKNCRSHMHIANETPVRETRTRIQNWSEGKRSTACSGVVMECLGASKYAPKTEMAEVIKVTPMLLNATRALSARS